MIALELSLNGIKLEMGEHRTGFSIGSRNEKKKYFDGCDAFQRCYFGSAIQSKCIYTKKDVKPVQLK